LYSWSFGPEQKKIACRIVERLQKSYIRADRILEPDNEHFITVGRFLSDLPESQKSRKQSAGFINDIFISLSALSIGAILFTVNISDFKFIASKITGLKLIYLTT
jgi:predicted nucleic acid-binding protein